MVILGHRVVKKDINCCVSLTPKGQLNYLLDTRKQLKAEYFDWLDYSVQLTGHLPIPETQKIFPLKMSKSRVANALDYIH